ncbi:DUF4342 domain-containing protein [Candidatus Saccharibacteria bacterium oral taxon 955]|nr:DUF4342 domain-containing protein [Candidatus Saccharibacteria bacterium oral taxon 955]QJU06001.1 DUF4342 domain-containing protein [Candidatus Saccharibacteria bacterium oral taxon 955]
MTKQKLILTSIATLVVIGGLSLGALLLPTLAALGAAVALMTQCTIAVERRDNKHELLCPPKAHIQTY